MKLLNTSLAAAGILAMGLDARALDFDFSGTFRKDNDVVHLLFSVGAASNVRVVSSSWDDGGFDPILAIWDSAGNLIEEQDDGGISGDFDSNGTTYDHGVWDSDYTVFLAPGTYTATIAQYDNFAVSTLLSDGFQQDGNDNFTFDNGWGPQPYFNGIDGRQNTGNWVFHIIGADSAVVVPSVPDAGATLALLGLSVLGLDAFRRKFARQA